MIQMHVLVKGRKKMFDLILNIHGKIFKLTKERGKIKIEVRQVFPNMIAFKKAVREYAMSKGYDIRRRENQSYGIVWSYHGDKYPWRNHATIIGDGNNFMVKKPINPYSCIGLGKNKNANNTWLAKKTITLPQSGPKMSYDLLKKFLDKNYQVEPHCMKI